MYKKAIVLEIVKRAVVGSRTSQRVTKNDGLELVEGPTTSETENEMTDRGGGDNVGTPATP
jgi:hypothetical protein